MFNQESKTLPRIFPIISIYWEYWKSWIEFIDFNVIYFLKILKYYLFRFYLYCVLLIRLAIHTQIFLWNHLFTLRFSDVSAKNADMQIVAKHTGKLSFSVLCSWDLLMQVILFGNIISDMLMIFHPRCCSFSSATESTVFGFFLDLHLWKCEYLS